MAILMVYQGNGVLGLLLSADSLSAARHSDVQDHHIFF